MNIFSKATLVAFSFATALTGASPASADIEDWLRRNFSTNDFVGDWLRDVFTPVNGEDDDFFNGPSVHSEGYKDAVMIMKGWERPSKDEKIKVAARLCEGEELLHVILETKSQKAVAEKCFK